MKINFGLRYDLYLIPKSPCNATGAQASPLAMSAEREKASGINSSSFYANAVTPLENAAFASGDACAPVGINTKFNVDKNNLAPRLGIVYSIVGYSDVTVTNVNPTTGELIGGLPDFRTRNSSIAQESRQVQLGFKFIF